MPKRLINTIKQHSQGYFHYKYNYAPRDNNTFQLYTEGNQFYPSILESINNAQSSIYIIQYIYETSLTSNKITDALIKARSRDVTVHLILDAYGSKNLSQQERQRLINSDVKIFLFNPLHNHHLIKFLYRDHRKLLIIDSKTAYLGGAGISDDYNFPIEQPKGWLDIIIKISGPLVQNCEQLFNQQIALHKGTKTKKTPKVKVPNLILGPSQARLLTSKSWRKNEIQRAIIHAINKSTQRVWITTPYFIPSRKLRSHLKLAAHRGCDVRILLPGEDSDHPWVGQIARHRYTRLLKNNIHIFEYQPRFTHAKVILCDDWICAGSSNFDLWNQKFNLELNIEIKSKTLSQQLERFFIANFSQSKQITADIWGARPPMQRIREWFWSKVAIWIERLIHNMR